MFKHTR